MEVTKRQALKYAALPGFIPRIFALATSGFSTFAFYIAVVYNMVNLLPNGHPYLIRQNIGKYGVRHVLGAAANNLVFKWKNIDQIIIYFTILGGIVLIAVQLILFGMALMAHQNAFAIGFDLSIPDLFRNPGAAGSLGPSQDIAFIILDRVFGLVGIYESCISQGIACEDNAGNPIPESAVAYPYPFHEALHLMLRYYSMGIVAIAAMMFVYFTITVVGETAATGTPFGQRFNRAWVPVRFVIFFALLLPLNIGDRNEGLNGGQIITFWVAKHGSNFATNGWAYFNSRMVTETFLGPQANIIAEPNKPEMGALNQFILVAKTCAIAENMEMAKDDPIRSTAAAQVQPYIVRPPPPSYSAHTVNGPGATPDSIDLIGTTYGNAIDFAGNGNIRIRIGRRGIDRTGSGVVEEYSNYGGNVFPFCGDMTIQTTDRFQPGSVYIAEEYYNLIERLWLDTNTHNVAECLVRVHLNVGQNVDLNCPDLLNDAYVDGLKAYYDSYVEAAINAGINRQRTNGDFLVPTELIEKGWAGAAIWYNRVAEMNGAVVDAVANIPRHDKYPWVMELVHEERRRQSATVSGSSRYNIRLPDRVIELPDERHTRIYPAIYRAYNYFEKSDANAQAPTGNTFIDTVNLVLGTSGLFEMRENADTHPLAQLSAIGKGMMAAVVRNTGIAAAGIVGGGLAGIIDPFPSEIAKIGTEFMWTVILATIGIAVILYYVLPFLPFIYFLFAVSGWVKSIFEAIVAMPLWALAHIRIDGEGIPGQDAANGYFLLLEIFLRPILILIGLISSITIFAALVSVLNQIFTLIVGNLTGNDVELEQQIASGAASLPSSIADFRGPIDEFFFTAMYAIICYLMGISCFKLIDLIPNNILRWMGTNVATFQENAGDPAGQLTNQVYRGSVLVGNQVKGATQGNLQAILS